MLSDTPVEIEELQAAMFRALPAERRMALIDSMYRSGKELADAGLRLRKPAATQRECLENWVRLTVPAELVAQALEVVVDTAESALSEVRHLANKLSRLGLEIVLGGSVASSLYTKPRHTQDADVSIASFPGREAELVECLQDDYYVSLPAVRSAVQNHRSFNVLRMATSFKIDIFVQGDRPFDASAMQRKRLLASNDPGDSPLFVHTAEDVVLHKLAWYRLGDEVSDRQWGDISGILRTQRGNLDLSYLRTWAAPLQVSDLLERALSEVEGTTSL
jgi:hypothetical protein